MMQRLFSSAATSTWAKTTPVVKVAPGASVAVASPDLIVTGRRGDHDPSLLRLKSAQRNGDGSTCCGGYPAPLVSGSWAAPCALAGEPAKRQRLQSRTGMGDLMTCVSSVFPRPTYPPPLRRARRYEWNGMLTTIPS